MQKCHSIEEVARVLEYLSAGIGNWVSHRLYALVATVAYTGLHRDEALTLMVIDVSLVWGVLNISDRQQRRPKRARRPCRYRPNFSEILRAWLPRCGCEWVFPGVGGDASLDRGRMRGASRRPSSAGWSGSRSHRVHPTESPTHLGYPCSPPMGTLRHRGRDGAKAFIAGDPSVVRARQSGSVRDRPVGFQSELPTERGRNHAQGRL